jgi:hypothetical protein
VSNNTVRVLARNVSSGALDLAAATPSVAVTKPLIPWSPNRAAPLTTPWPP